ncbi:hypothetical protein [Actinocorallia populi]|uniref:hypothetical protein n=1 Tax=Actinocorallia populi TaxID=2079200 RepID=UPI000D08ABA6|nr:hypothetical protein [Actinocorallia populi]
MRSRPHPLILALAVAAVQALMVLAFAWPSANTAPRDVPLGVAGPAAAVTQLTQRLEQAQPGAFEVRTYADEAAARQAIEDREVYGAVAVTPQGPRVLTASAASPAVSQALVQLAAAQAGTPAPAVEDVVSADPDDPRGTGFATMILPLVMSGIAASAALTLLVRAARDRLLGVLVFAAAGGLLTALVAQTWLSLTPGSYLEVAAVAALASLATAAPITGLASLIGPPGIGAGALTLLFLGNPFSGAATGPELLPQPWGALGQFLQPGAAASLLRSVTFFDGAAARTPLLVLTAWALLGLALLAAALRRPPTAATAPDEEPVVLTA